MLLGLLNSIVGCKQGPTKKKQPEIPQNGEKINDTKNQKETQQAAIQQQPTNQNNMEAERENSGVSDGQIELGQGQSSDHNPFNQNNDY